MNQKLKEMSWIERFNFERILLRSILAHSVSHELPKLPAHNKLVYNELINGIVAYVDGDAGRIKFGRKDADQIGEYKFDYSSYDRNGCFYPFVFVYFQQELENADKRLTRSIEESLVELLNPGLGLIYARTCFDNDFDGGGLGGICDSYPTVGEGTFTLRDEIINNSRRIMRSDYFTKHQKADIRGIGESMRPFIKEDIAFIKSGRYSSPILMFS